MFCKLYFAWELFYYYKRNKIGDIGTKYIGLGLSKLNKLTYLKLWINTLFIVIDLLNYI